MSKILHRQRRSCPFKSSSTFVLASLLLTAAPLVGDAQETAIAQPQLGANFTQWSQPAHDGLIFSGSIPGPQPLSRFRSVWLQR